MIDSSFINYSTPQTPNGIDSSLITYTKKLDPIELVLMEESLNKYEKIDKIQKILVENYKILDGDMAYYLAASALGDKAILKSLVKQSKKLQKKLKKKKK